MHDRADQPFGLSQTQPEDGSESQCRGDRQLRIPRLTTPGGAWLSPPGCDSFIRYPDREAAALPQRAASYSDQLLTRWRWRGMWCRPAAWNLKGMTGVLGPMVGGYRYPARLWTPTGADPCNKVPPGTSSGLGSLIMLPNFSCRSRSSWLSARTFGRGLAARTADRRLGRSSQGRQYSRTGPVRWAVIDSRALYAAARTALPPVLREM